MKSKLARILRKWAELIDPHVKPSDAITVCVNIDAWGMKEVERVEQIARQTIAKNVIYDKCGNRRLRSL